MRGTGPVGVNTEVVYGYYTVDRDVVRLRLSLDEKDRFGLVEGLPVRVRLPGREPAEVLVTAVSEAPPFVWVEFAPVVGRIASRAG